MLQENTSNSKKIAVYIKKKTVKDYIFINIYEI